MDVIFDLKKSNRKCINVTMTIRGEHSTAKSNSTVASRGGFFNTFMVEGVVGHYRFVEF